MVESGKIFISKSHRLCYT